MRNKRELSEEQEMMGGDQDLLVKEDLLAKYRERAKGAITKPKVERSIKLIDNLKNLTEIPKLMALMRGCQK